MIDMIARKYRNWKVYNATRNELAQLSNRELRDLGIGRADIDFVARKHSH